MAFQNRLIKKIPSLDENLVDREDAQFEDALASGAIGDEDTLVEKHEPTSAAMTSDTFEYQKINFNLSMENFCSFSIQSEDVSPTVKDYEKGFFMRYFIKRYDGEPIEVSKTQLKRIKALTEKALGLYTTCGLRWHLSPQKVQLPKGALSGVGVVTRIKAMEVGSANQDIAKINERYTRISDETLGGGLIKYIGGAYTQFTVTGNDSIESNLYTPGGEFYRANGTQYIGYYHIHSTKGPMVGKVHTAEPHDVLIHKSKLRSKSDVSSPMETSEPKTTKTISQASSMQTVTQASSGAQTSSY